MDKKLLYLVFSFKIGGQSELEFEKYDKRVKGDIEENYVLNINTISLFARKVNNHCDSNKQINNLE